MIESKEDYRLYLASDAEALKVSGSLYQRLVNDIWAYQRALRRVEFVTNVRSHPLARILARYRLRRLGRRLGFSIPPNVFGPGLSIAHYGTIVVNGGARVGANCRLHVGVVIGTAAQQDDAAPTIGSGHTSGLAPRYLVQLFLATTFL